MERKPTGYAAVILATIIGLLVAYPLSAGPAGFAIQWGCWWAENNTAAELAMWFYWPLFRLAEPPNNWVIRWWNCGTRLAGWTWVQTNGLGGLVDQF